ncbi:hypothetical protein JQ544_01550 [Bradyrhizobium diazoefficiens]|nr:hypothetical protein [Bradyrhizobium diazoefficiens]MBR0810192.1 hypothetical protein [Bradyrhizobium diazoefficiens]
MEREAPYRGTVYPWQSDIAGLHMDRSQRSSAPFVDAIREIALRHLAEVVEV